MNECELITQIELKITTLVNMLLRALIIHSLVPSLIHSFIPFRNYLLLLLACRLMDSQAQPKAVAMEWNVSATARELGIYLDPPTYPLNILPSYKRHIK